jgi:iron uptake system component EfeO
VLGCKSEPAAPAPRAESTAEQSVRRGLQALIARELDAWLAATRELDAAIPEPRDTGWSELDRPALEAMRAAWGRGRVAYERIEGAVAPIFPESDTATDARYDDFLMRLGAAGDADAFDAEGVIGMHAIERVLWADSIPPEVVQFEQALPGYRAAAFPSSRADAARFKHELVARLIRDVNELRAQFTAVELDTAFAFRGLIDLSTEQAEKVDRAATGQEESRYAQATMRDLRANQRGCRDTYELFRPWLAAQPDGASHDAAVLAAFERLDHAYAAIAGDAIPRPPRTWSSLDPKLNDTHTDFGKLFLVVASETDASRPGSLHASLLAAAKSLGMPDPVTR